MRDIKRISTKRRKANIIIRMVTSTIKNAKDIFFSIVELLSALASIGGFIFIFIKYKNAQTEYTSLLIIVILVLVAFTVFLVLRMYKLAIQTKQHDELKNKISDLDNDLYRSNELTNDMIHAIHNIIHESRSRMQIIYDDIINENFDQTIERQESFKKYLMYVLSNIKEIYDNITCQTCAISIKILELESCQNEPSSSGSKGDSCYNKFMISTLYRDSVSFRHRNKYSEENNRFEVSSNTAFDIILSPNNNVSYYYSNDLQGEHSYINSNRHWKKLYNATLVVPIRTPIFSNGKYTGGYDVIGFITVDNFLGGFNDTLAYNALATIADNIYHVFILQSDFMELANTNKGSKQ